MEHQVLSHQNPDRWGLGNKITLVRENTIVSFLAVVLCLLGHFFGQNLVIGYICDMCI